jgi:hypothetical protein
VNRKLLGVVLEHFSDAHVMSAVDKPAIGCVSVNVLDASAGVINGFRLVIPQATSRRRSAHGRKTAQIE